MKNLFAACAAATLWAMLSTGASAQLGGAPAKSTLQGGEAVYKGLCQACHMPDAKGATGAASYPALANNPKLEEPGFPASVVIHGQKAMPGFGGLLNDQQVADVVNYIRTHFGNNYKDAVIAADVKAAR